jgi:hypothetical protein
MRREATSDDGPVTTGHAVLIAYYFPPLAGVASDRTAAMARHLGALGWEPVVITPREGFYHRSAVGAADDGAATVRTPSLELSRLLRQAYARAPREEGGGALAVRPVETGRVGGALRGLVRDFVYVPDAQVGWIPFAARAASAALRAGDGPRVVFSTSVPYSAHLAAMIAARRSGAPWVAEFRDPWSTGTSPSRSQRPARRRVDRALEGRIVRRADHVVVTTATTRAELLAAHPGLAPERVSVVTNGFEPGPVGEPPGSDAPMMLLYAGTVAPGEDMEPVLAVLDGVHARHAGAFRLRVLGPEAPWRSAPQRPWLELGGVVSPEQAREAMAGSSALLLVQRHPAYRGIVPGKLFEYVGARRPVLAVGPRGTEMEGLLRAHADARLVDAAGLADLAPAVERLLEEHLAGDLQAPRVDEEVVAPLRRAEQARQLAAIFARVAR